MPFTHFVLVIPPESTAADLWSMYETLVRLGRAAQAAAHVASKDYNVAMYKDWIAVIPRTTAVSGAPFRANALGLLGMISVRDQQERTEWAELGYTAYLSKLGVPREP